MSKILLFYCLGLIMGAFTAWLLMPPTEPISPCPMGGCQIIIETPAPSPTPTPKPTVRGRASYYSRSGCLGCSATLTMANGEPLDDNRVTMAYNHAPMNSKMYVTNVKTGKRVLVTVSDTGGFERHGRIADLSVAAKNALGCGDICTIEIEL